MLHDTNRRRCIVITGGSDGIGLGIAEAFARSENAHFIIVGVEPAGVAAAIDRLAALGSAADGICTDLSVPAETMALPGKVRALTSRVDVLINNVGMIRFTPLGKVTEAEFDAFVTLSIKAAYFLTQGLLPLLGEAGGCVINLTSYFATKNIPGRQSTLYSMTKGAIASLTKAMACELGPDGIRVNAIAPGTVESPGRTANIRLMAQADQERLAAYNQASYPIGRIGRPSDVGGLAVYLASPAAEWMTGSVVAIDGGLTTT